MSQILKKNEELCIKQRIKKVENKKKIKRIKKAENKKNKENKESREQKKKKNKEKKAIAIQNNKINCTVQNLNALRYIQKS